MAYIIKVCIILCIDNFRHSFLSKTYSNKYWAVKSSNLENLQQVESVSSHLSSISLQKDLLEFMDGKFKQLQNETKVLDKGISTHISHDRNDVKDFLNLTGSKIISNSLFKNNEEQKKRTIVQIYKINAIEVI